MRPSTSGRRRAAAKPPVRSILTIARDAVDGGRARAGRPRRFPRPRARTGLAALAMAFAGGMLFVTSVPALAITATAERAGNPVADVYAPAPVADVVIAAPQIMEVSDLAAPAPVATGGFAVEAAPPPIQSSVAGLGQVSILQSDLVVWPVQNPSRISDGFGPRSAPCSGCSTSHDGVDFLPGVGTPVMSIADGVVVLATENGGGLGVNVEVQHNIDGRLITSSYAHMQSGSMTVSVGQQVTAGQQLGRVGTTGQSTGPHLHLEMFGADGVRFDGMAWLHARLG